MGKDALELFLKHMPDFIFIDVMMPVMNGIDALKAIKKCSKRQGNNGHSG